MGILKTNRIASDQMLQKKSFLTAAFIFVVLITAGVYFFLENPVYKLEKVESSDKALVYSIVGKIKPYSRGGVFERYGASVDSQHDNPVSSDKLYVFPYRDASLLQFTEFTFPERYADEIRIKMSSKDEVDLIAFGITFLDGTTWLVNHPSNSLEEEHFEKAVSIQHSQRKTILDADKIMSMQRFEDGTYIGKLPEPVNLKEIKSVFAVFDELEGVEKFEISSWGFFGGAKKDICNGQKTRSLSGELIPFRDKYQDVYILTEGGNRLHTTINDGKFKFDSVPCEEALKAVFYESYYENMEFYSQDGRWFSAKEIDSIKINANPPYEASPDKLVPEREDQGFDRIYFRDPPERIGNSKPHTRQYNIGKPGRVQYWDQSTFNNMHGFWDRDRFEGNPSQCLRVMLIGESHITSIHMKTGDKFNIMAEEELSILLKRCVEIITAGEGSGHIGSYSRYIREYAPIIQPDLILVSTSSLILLPLDTDFLKSMRGIDPDHNRWDQYKRDDNGRLYLEPKDKNYRKYISEVNRQPYVGCIPLNDTASTNALDTPQKVQNIWTLYGDILDQLEKESGYEIGLLGITQAIMGSRDRTLGENICVTPEGRTYHYGEGQFIRNMEKFCKKENRFCAISRIPVIWPLKESKWLTWPNDMHMHWRGHQYIAHELARNLYNYFNTSLTEGEKATSYNDIAIPALKQEISFSTNDSGHIDLPHRGLIDALETLIKLPKSKRRDFLQPMEEVYFDGYKEFLTTLRDHSGYEFCSLEIEGRQCWSKDQSIILRYDVHIRDLLPAIVLSFIHEELKIPAVFHVMDINSVNYLPYIRYYEMFREHSSDYSRMAPHVSIMCSFFEHALYPEEHLACNKKEVINNFVDRLKSDEGPQLYEKTISGTERLWSLTSAVFKEIHGHDFKSVALHGTPYRKTMRQIMEKNPGFYRSYPLIKTENLLEYLIDKTNGKIIEHNFLTKLEEDQIFLSEGRNPDMSKEIMTLFKDYNNLGILIHPYSLLNGRAKFEKNEVIKNLTPLKH